LYLKKINTFIGAEIGVTISTKYKNNLSTAENRFNKIGEERYKWTSK
jgi:hypothetical protein